MIVDDIKTLKEEKLNYDEPIYIKNPAKNITSNTNSKVLIDCLKEEGINIHDFLDKYNLKSENFYNDYMNWMTFDEMISFFDACQKEFKSMNPRNFQEYALKSVEIHQSLHNFLYLLLYNTSFKFIYKLLPKINRTYNNVCTMQYLKSKRETNKLTITILYKLFQNYVNSIDIKHVFWVIGNLLSIPILKDYANAKCNIKYYGYDIFTLLNKDYSYLKLAVYEKDDFIYINNQAYLQKVILKKERVKCDFSIFNLLKKNIYKFIYSENILDYCEKNDLNQDYTLCYKVIKNFIDAEKNETVLAKDEIFNMPYYKLEIEIDLKSRKRLNHKTSDKKSLYIYLEKLKNQVIEIEKAKEELNRLNESLEEKVRTRTLELETAKNQIEQQSQQKTALFINLAHETKTPLTLIRNYLDKYLKNHTQDSDLLVIKSNIDKLTRDMVNFLDAEKIEQQRLIYDPSAVIDFSTLLEEKIKLFQTLADKKQIILTSSIEPGISFLSDPYGLDRIINNLLDNAIRYTPENGKVTLILKRPEPEQILFQVEDTGRGIPAAQQQHIFNKYYQISGEKQNIQGMGMGLFITKSIVEQLNGSISFISLENKGASFTVLFKTLSQPGKETDKDFIPSRPIDSLSHTAAYSLTAYDTNKYSILIVEDNIALLHALRQSLTEIYNVYTAVNGLEAMDFLESNHPVDIIITDIMMDGMDGYAFYRELQKEEKWRSIPLIFLTARTTQEEKITGLKTGAVDYIFKPFYMDELIYKIQAILKNRTLQKILIEKQKYIELGKLAAGIAHQILNPLTGVDAPLQFIEKDIEESNRIDPEDVKQIRLNVEKVKEIVKSLRHLNYNSANMNEEVVLRNILDSVVTLIPKDVKGRIDFQINIERNYIVKGNTAAFNHIFLNLISNAVDAIPEKGEIRFDVIKHDHDLIISVADTGTGVREEDLSKIFDMDFTTKSVGKGTGLGLYLVKNLVKKMGWEIRVESREKAGTTFYLIKKEGNIQQL